MKFNDREIAVKGTGQVDLEGVFQYLRPQSNDWANWYSQPVYKERKFKLVSNLLFYYRLDDAEPIGVLVLENFTVQHEKPFHGVSFPFSIEFADELQRKHIFACKCQADADKWVSKLKSASYEYWRTELSILQKKISMRTGRDPMMLYSRNQCEVEPLAWSKHKTVGQNKSSFRCHIEESTSGSHNNVTINNIEPKATEQVANLIEF